MDPVSANSRYAKQLPKKECIAGKSISPVFVGVECPRLQITMLSFAQTISGESGLPCRWQGRSIPNASEVIHFIGTSHAGDRAHFRLTPRIRVIACDQN